MPSDFVGKKQLQGAVCLYEKYNGYGEYIFDWGWANAYEKYGLNYYPKLVSAIPFTPATGLKLLVHTEADTSNVRKKLLEEAYCFVCVQETVPLSIFYSLLQKSCQSLNPWDF